MEIVASLKRSGRWVLLTIALAAAGGAALMLLSPGTNPPPFKLDNLTIDPGVSVDPRQSYEITLWETAINVPGQPDGYRTALQGALIEFQDRYPSVAVSIEFIPPHELPQRLEEALQAGSPPDVVAMPEPQAPQRLQVPVTPYLAAYMNNREKDQEGETPPLYHPAARDPWFVDEHLWAFPRWIYWEAWAAHQGDLIARGIDVDDIIRYGWTWDDVLEIARHLREDKSSGGASVDVTNPTLYLQLIANAGAPWWATKEGLLWSEQTLEEVAQFLQRLHERGTLGPRPATGAVERVARFVEEKSLLTAPVNPWLFKALQERLGDEVVLLPVPHHPKQHEVAWLVPSGYAVFRQEPYRGDETLRASMELASFLSARLGPWTAQHVGLLPASPRDLRQWEERANLHPLARTFLRDYGTHFPSREGQSTPTHLLPPLQTRSALQEAALTLWEQETPSPSHWAQDTARKLGITASNGAR